MVDSLSCVFHDVMHYPVYPVCFMIHYPVFHELMHYPVRFMMHYPVCTMVHYPVFMCYLVCIDDKSFVS